MTVTGSLVERTPIGADPPPFPVTLRRHGLELTRGKTDTLQVNVGYLCNLACRHCHLDCGPHRTESMSPETMRAVTDYARRGGFEIVDVTGGSPEMVPGMVVFLEALAGTAPRLMLRTNLTASQAAGGADLWELCRDLKIEIIASCPATERGATDAQRGPGSWDLIVEGIRRLNALGYGRDGSGLELRLVSNPDGAFPGPSQFEKEQIFRAELGKLGLVFNDLLSFTNVPLGRFGSWLEREGARGVYLEELAGTFNPAAVAGLMCRSLVTVDWRGQLYDCDFNLAAGLPLAGRKVHVTELDGPPPAGSPIATALHCYACTAGAGFT